MERGLYSLFPYFLPITYTIYLCIRYTNDTTAHIVGWKFSMAKIFCLVLTFQYQKISTSHSRHSPLGRPTALCSVNSSTICFVASQMWVAIRLCVFVCYNVWVGPNSCGWGYRSECTRHFEFCASSFGGAINKRWVARKFTRWVSFQLKKWQKTERLFLNKAN